MDDRRFRLYVAGNGPNSTAARRNLAGLIEELNVSIDVEVVDVFEHPDRALEDRIFLTPMLVRVHPRPVRRIAGNLSVTDPVRALLSDEVDHA